MSGLLRATALALLPALALAGCLEGGTGAPPAAGTVPATATPVASPPSGQLEPLPVRTLAKGSFSGIQEDRRAVLRDEPSWRALWEEHGKDGELPRAEFPNETVLAVVVRGPTGCAQAHVGNVTFDDGARVTDVEVVLETAPSNVQCLVAFEDVYHFVAVPSRAGEVRFRDVQEPAPEEPAPKEGEYPFRTLAQGQTSGITDVRRVVLTTEAEWEATWEQHASTEMPPPARPAVDFARESVLVVTAGAKPNTCHAIGVDAIEIGDESVRVTVTSRLPPAQSACGMAIVHPFHFVTYPRTDLPATFLERAVA